MVAWWIFRQVFLQFIASLSEPSWSLWVTEPRVLRRSNYQLDGCEKRWPQSPTTVRHTFACTQSWQRPRTFEMPRHHWKSRSWKSSCWKPIANISVAKEESLLGRKEHNRTQEYAKMSVDMNSMFRNQLVIEISSSQGLRPTKAQPHTKQDR